MDREEVARRTYLETVLTTGAMAGIAGCSSLGDGSPTANRSESETRTERSTTTSQPANLQVETALPDVVSVGEALEVDVQLSNDGGQSATQQFVLRTNDKALATEEITVPPNDSRTLTLSSTISRAPRNEQLELRLGKSSIGSVRVPSPSEVDGVSVPDRPAERRAGATYVNPKYRLDRSRDILNEGAHVLEQLGTGVFKGGAIPG